jgi:hypothetical protein
MPPPNGGSRGLYHRRIVQSVGVRHDEVESVPLCADPHDVRVFGSMDRPRVPRDAHGVAGRIQRAHDARPAVALAKGRAVPIARPPVGRLHEVIARIGEGQPHPQPSRREKGRFDTERDLGPFRCDAVITDLGRPAYSKELRMVPDQRCNRWWIFESTLGSSSGSAPGSGRNTRPVRPRSRRCGLACNQVPGAISGATSTPNIARMSNRSG